MSKAIGLAPDIDTTDNAVDFPETLEESADTYSNDDMGVMLSEIEDDEYAIF